MKKVFTFLLLCALASASAGTYEEELGKLSKDLSDAIEQAGLKTVAVANFKDLQGKDNDLGRMLAEDFSIDLFNHRKGVSLIDRTHLARLMEEKKLTEEGLMDPNNSKELKLAGIDAIVFGTVVPFEKTYRVSLKAIDTQTAKVVAATRGSIVETDSLDSLAGVAKATSDPGASKTLSAPVLDEGGKASKPKSKSIYDLGEVAVEINSVIFDKRACLIRVTYSVTSKGKPQRFTYDLSDVSARHSPGSFDPNIPSDYRIDGSATDNNGMNYKLLMPSSASSAPLLPPDSPVAFKIEYQILAEPGQQIRIPESVDFSFPFKVGNSYFAQDNPALKFSVVDIPISKAQ